MRVREVDRLGFARDETDEAFVRLHDGQMHGFGVQALRGVELEHAVDAQHIGGANLRHHVGGDQHDNLVQAFLRADRLRHDFAETAQ